MNSSVINEANQNQQKKRRKITEFRVWKQAKFNKEKNIIAKANRDQMAIKQYTAELKMEEDFQLGKVRVNKKKYKGKGNGLFEQFSDCSEICQQHLNVVYKNRNMMKKEAKVIGKLNAESLFQIKKNHLKGLTKDDDLKELPNIANMKNEYYLRYLNDNLRKDVLRIFAAFNPLINLQNINDLMRNDINAKEEIELYKQEIFGKLEEKINNDYYKKRHQQLKRNVQSSTRKTKIDSNLPTAADNINNRLVKTASTAFRPPTSFKGKKKKKLRKSNKKKLTLKEQRDKEFDMLHDALDKIDLTLDKDLISNYINNYEHFSKDNYSIEQQYKYFPELENAERALKKIQLAKLAKPKEDETKLLEDKIAFEHRLLMNTITEGKGKLMYDLFIND